MPSRRARMAPARPMTMGCAAGAAPPGASRPSQALYPNPAGTRVAFLDQAHYSMVKTNTFNGMALPAIAIWNSQTDALRVVRQFGYDDFEGRLS